KMALGFFCFLVSFLVYFNSLFILWGAPPVFLFFFTIIGGLSVGVFFVYFLVVVLFFVTVWLFVFYIISLYFLFFSCLFLLLFFFCCLLLFGFLFFLLCPYLLALTVF